MDNPTIRKQIKNKRQALAESCYHAMSLSCFDLLKPYLNSSIQHIAIYLPIQNEVDTFPIIDYLWNKGKHIYIPKCFENNQMAFYEIKSLDDVSIGKYNIPEPKNLENERNKFDVMIVPLVGFNAHLYRLGNGGGYYDRYMQHIDCLKIGLAFDFQKVDFDVKSHDMQFDVVITECKTFSSGNL